MRKYFYEIFNKKIKDIEVPSNNIPMKNILAKSLILTISLLSIIGCSSRGSKQEKEEAKKPNIIFFIADDMYPWMFNNTPEGKTKDGKPRNLTPNIDRLAKEGVWLENMTVVSPVCTPSRYNSLTGNYASRAVNEEQMTEIMFIR